MVSTTDECIAEPVAVIPTTDMTNITEMDIDKAQKMFQQGKKNLILNKYDESVNNMGEACKIYSAKFGEFGEQCAEIYFFYGKSLLELARVENTVLGNALTGVPEETEPINDSRYGNPDDVEAEEQKEISDKVIDALCNNDEVAVEIAPTTTETVPAVTETAPAVAETVPAATEAASVATEGEAVAEGEEDEDEEEEEEAEGEGECEEVEGEEKNEEADADAEDISNLQQAWEMFEMAKLTYTKNFENDLVFKNKRIAECFLKLGEISIEQENFSQAILDINEAIKLQEEQATEIRDERMLAETFYQLGLALQFNNQFAEAKEAYQKSVNIIQFRIEKLKGKMMGITAEDNDADLERNTIKEEITEMEKFLPEMATKIEEVNDQGQQSINLIQEAKECFQTTVVTGTTEGSVSNGEVKDITSMVKSKRKVSSSNLNELENESDVKKTKTCDETATTNTEQTASDSTVPVMTTNEATPCVEAAVEEAVATTA